MIRCTLRPLDFLRPKKIIHDDYLRPKKVIHDRFTLRPLASLRPKKGWWFSPPKKRVIHAWFSPPKKKSFMMIFSAQKRVIHDRFTLRPLAFLRPKEGFSDQKKVIHDRYYLAPPWFSPPKEKAHAWSIFHCAPQYPETNRSHSGSSGEGLRIP